MGLFDDYFQTGANRGNTKVPVYDRTGQSVVSMTQRPVGYIMNPNIASPIPRPNIPTTPKPMSNFRISGLPVSNPLQAMAEYNEKMQQQTRPSSMLAKIRSGLGASPTSPVGMAISSGAQSLLEQSGYSPVPRTTGEIVGKALGAAREGYMGGLALEQAEAEKALARRLADRDYNLEVFKALNPTPKSSAKERDRARLFELANLVDMGTASQQEQQEYALLARDFSDEKTTLLPNGDTITQPALDFEVLGFPEPVGGFLKPRKTKKSDFSQTELQNVGFADRMSFAIQNLDRLEASGYTAPTLRDVSMNALGINTAVSPEGRLYYNNAMNFINAQLRQESGAAIAASEFENAYKTYFPVFGDDAKTINQKKQLRKAALNAMIGGGGDAWEGVERPEIKLGSENYPFFYEDVGEVERDFQSGTLRVGDFININGQLLQVEDI